MRVYLDNAATTPLDKEVLDAMTPFMLEHFGNPSSIHSHGREVRAAIEKARKTVAGLLNTSPAEVFFTSGGTEADNAALVCTCRSLNIKHAVTSKMEHHAVLHTMELLEKQEGVHVTYLRHDGQGVLDLEHLEEVLANQPQTLVSIMHANNEIGNLNDVEAIGAICRKYNAVFHSDTVQTMGHYKHDLQQLNANFIVGSAHKFHGPKGVGFLYCDAGTKIQPLIQGGAQERNMRGGTENVYGIIGLAKALEIAYRDMEDHTRHIQNLKDRMIHQLREQMEDVSFNGLSEFGDKSLYTVLNVNLPASDINEMLLFSLDISKISASGGSACSSGANTGSHVLRALGCDPSRGSVRFSFSKYNTAEEIDYAAATLAKMYKKQLA
ncbi:cysteine desulfurase family protein [Pontibacter akesuensis]|uniref:Cysteine desulfurase n=1 Tax=Pontibacter akesuensis TaxID=388950 RepID=A0A1I7IJD8_9BACT|nr:cysteine desulfurase family protein [Pontibacter akesuensis]GHA67485.1 cysteine desulfurase [Pontibacter akesuensis]SFU73032.1 cysteine desulfurase [Pontibacter akesuensis]